MRSGEIGCVAQFDVMTKEQALAVIAEPDVRGVQSSTVREEMYCRGSVKRGHVQLLPWLERESNALFTLTWRVQLRPNAFRR